MKTRRWLLGGLGACLLASAAWAAATGTVQGSVSRPNGPLVGARVVIASGTDSRYTATGTTDQQGRFSFSGTPLGNVEVKVYDSQQNILARRRGVLHNAGEIITLVFELAP